MSNEFKIWNDENGNWIAQVLDGGPTYSFQYIGDVEAFGNAMARGSAQDLIAEIPNIFTDDVDPEVIYNSLLEDCSTLYYFEESYVAVDGASLAEELVDAGEWLVAIIALLERRKKHMADQDEKYKLLGSWQPKPLPRTTGMKLEAVELAKDHHHGLTHQPSQEPKTTKGLLGRAHLNSVIAGVDADFSLTFTNWTRTNGGVTFPCKYWEVDLSAVAGTVIQTPSNSLKPSYDTTLSWYQIISWLAHGNNQAWVVYTTPKGKVFGVKIVVPVQVGPFGYPPYYQVSTDGQNWSGNYQSDSYTFDTSLGYEITVKPTAGRTNLFLGITINDLKADK